MATVAKVQRLLKLLSYTDVDASCPVFVVKLLIHVLRLRGLCS